MVGNPASAADKEEAPDARRCSLCNVRLMSRDGGRDVDCEAEQRMIQRRAWPFLASQETSVCESCGQDRKQHSVGVQGGRFCKREAIKPLCCLCETKRVGRCTERRCAACKRRSQAVLEASVRERMQAAVPPAHLVVLLHGLYGHPTEMLLLQNRLAAFRNKQGHTTFIPFAPDCYVDKTHFGVEAIGEFVIVAVKEFVALCNKVSPNTLTQISFVCHSLGGLIGRYAVGKLADREEEEQQTIAGLKAKSFVSIASPNLGLDGGPGVRRLPGAVTRLVSWLFAGSSGSDIFGSDAREGVVRRLAEAGGEFVEGLGRFEGRRMYALEGGDHIIGADRSLLLPPERFRPRSAPPSTPLHPAVQVWALHGPSPPALLSEPWAAPLEALGWSKLLLRMPSIPWWLPNGHLKIIANHREGLSGDAEGLLVMEDVVDFLAGRGESSTLLLLARPQSRPESESSSSDD